MAKAKASGETIKGKKDEEMDVKITLWANGF